MCLSRGSHACWESHLHCSRRFLQPSFQAMLPLCASGFRLPCHTYLFTSLSSRLVSFIHSLIHSFIHSMNKEIGAPIAHQGMIRSFGALGKSLMQNTDLLWEHKGAVSMTLAGSPLKCQAVQVQSMCVCVCVCMHTQAHTQTPRLPCSGWVLDTQGVPCPMQFPATLARKAGTAPSPVSPLLPSTRTSRELTTLELTSEG